MIALRRGDIAGAAQHIAGFPASMPHSPCPYARTETTLAQRRAANRAMKAAPKSPMKASPRMDFEENSRPAAIEMAK